MAASSWLGVSTVVKLLPSGALDNSFTSQAFAATTATPAPLIVQGATGLANGQLLVFGRFGSYGSLAGLSGLVRLNADGTPDNTFGPAVFPTDNRVFPGAAPAGRQAAGGQPEPLFGSDHRGAPQRQRHGR